jgi:hypothetical protein
MDPVPQDRLPAAPTATSAAERALLEVDAALELVRRGLASRVWLTGLVAIEPLLGVAVARAQAAGIAFSVDRTGASPGLTIGPRR